MKIKYIQQNIWNKMKIFLHEYVFKIIRVFVQLILCNNIFVQIKSSKNILVHMWMNYNFL